MSQKEADDAHRVNIVASMLATLHCESVWGRKYRGEDSRGGVIDPRSPDCVKWSIMGALTRTQGIYESIFSVSYAHDLAVGVYDEMVSVVLSRYSYRLRRLNAHTVTQFNEHPNTTYAQVCEFLKTVRQNFEGSHFMRFDHQTKPL